MIKSYLANPRRNDPSTEGTDMRHSAVKLFTVMGDISSETLVSGDMDRLETMINKFIADMGISDDNRALEYIQISTDYLEEGRFLIRAVVSYTRSNSKD